MKYIYILESIKHPAQIYSGMTDKLESIIAKHNGKLVPETAKYAPWKLRTYIAFSNEAQALAYEHYLKTEQGANYVKKRL